MQPRRPTLDEEGGSQRLDVCASSKPYNKKLKRTLAGKARSGELYVGPCVVPAKADGHRVNTSQLRRLSHERASSAQTHPVRRPSIGLRRPRYVRYTQPPNIDLSIGILNADNTCIYL